MVEPQILQIPTNSMSHKQDGAVLHFLKELPGVVWVFVLLLFFTIVYINYRDDFIPRIIDALIGAFLGLVVSTRTSRTNIATGKVEADTVSTRSMDNANVQAETISIEPKPKKGE